VRPRSCPAGFTLIELSVVLVIIGLVVGGVLVGQDLIRAAEFRADVATIEKLGSAVSTFQLKYNGLPGDLPNASNFFPGVSYIKGYGGRNGDGAIDAGPNNEGLINAETAAAFEDLALAEFVNLKPFAANDPNNNQPGIAYPVLRRGAGLVIFHPAGRAGHAFRTVAPASMPGQYTVNANSNLSAADALAFDTKIDDGLPYTGAVVARRCNYVDHNMDVIYSAANGLPATYDINGTGACIDADMTHYAHPGSANYSSGGLACGLKFAAPF
jgi:prepilin-type N-terminal cleavage/methylation domain-containing protein